MCEMSRQVDALLVQGSTVTQGQTEITTQKVKAEFLVTEKGGKETLFFACETDSHS